MRCVLIRKGEAVATISMMLFTLVLLGGCVSTPVLIDSSWGVYSVGGQLVGTGEIANQQPVFRFLPDSSQIMGFIGCNQFSAKYSQEKNVVKIDNVMSTKRSCPSMETEAKILSAFSRTTTVKRDDDVLRFYNGDTVLMECKSNLLPTKD